MPDIYIILGAAQSGRHEILKYLIDNALADNEKVVIYTPQNDPCPEWDAKLAERADTQLINWIIADKHLHTVNIKETEAEFIFILMDGKSNPIDQLEAFKEWLEQHQWCVTRIISVVNCQLAHQYPPLVEWFQAIIHFSDYVFLNNRESVPQKWINDFLHTFKKECYPCIFEYVKKGGKIGNPVAVLDSEIRRMTLEFDPGETIEFELDDEGVDFEEEAEGEALVDEEEMPFDFNENFNSQSVSSSQKDTHQEEKDFFEENTNLIEEGEDGEEEEEEEMLEDPYFEKNLTGGRKKKIPDIREFLI